jgi:hypothetical protein
MLMLPKHKLGTIQNALDAVKNRNADKVPSIVIDRTKARWAAKGGDDSIFVQIYKALGDVRILSSLRLSCLVCACVCICACFLRCVAVNSGLDRARVCVSVLRLLEQYAKTGTIFMGQERWWQVTFVGEHVSDAGGGFRETVSNLSDDLNSDRTPLMIPTPNNVHNAGNLVSRSNLLTRVGDFVLFVRMLQLRCTLLTLMV